jgi:hypothetical protein
MQVFRTFLRRWMLPILTAVLPVAASGQGIQGISVSQPAEYSSRATNYRWDNGLVGAAFRRGGGGDLCWIHAHTAIPGLERITEIHAAWGNNSIGLTARVFVWEDPNDDGNPNDAVLVAQETVTITNTGTFNVIPLSNPPKVTGVFFIGAAAVTVESLPYKYPILVDTTASPPSGLPSGRVWYTTAPMAINAVNLSANEGIVDASLGVTPYAPFASYMLLRATGATRDGFTYQGELRDGGVPVTTAYDLRFTLWNAAANGVAAPGTLQATITPDPSGRFTVFLPFPNASVQDAPWLEIQAAPSGSGTYSTLSPRQEITPTPFATYAYNAATTQWSGLVGIPAGFADGVDNDGGGDITAVTAGTGLTGGATTGAAVLNVNFAGTGVANSAARSDHTQAWTTITGVPAGFADGLDNDSGGDITAVTAGAGLTGGATTGAATLNVNFAGNGAAASAARSDHFHSLLNASDGSPAGVVSLDAAGLVTVTDPGGVSASVPALTVVADSGALGAYPVLTKQTGLKVMNTAGQGTLIANNMIASVGSAGQTSSLRVNPFGGSVLINRIGLDAAIPNFGLFVSGGGISSITTFNTPIPSVDDGNLYVENKAGIGTPSPETTLHVLRGTSSGVSSPEPSSSAILESSTTNYLSILSPDANVRGILFGSPVNVRDGGIHYNVSGLRGMHFRTNGNTTRMILDQSGKLLIAGSGTPSQALDVRGSIALGTAGELLALGGEENLRVLRGRVSDAGAVLQGTGFTVAKPSGGVYDITFTTAFSATPTPTATISGATIGFIKVGTISTNTCRINTYSTTGAAVDREFTFTVVGPR